MLARCGAAGCIVAFAIFLLAPLAAMGDAFGVPSEVLAYALLCVSALAFFAEEAMLVIGRSRDRLRLIRKARAASGSETGAGAQAHTQCVDDLVGMLGDTLKFAHPPPASERLEPVEIADLLRAVAAHLGSTRLKLQIHPQPIRTLANQPALGRAFEILIENALDSGTRAAVSCDHGTTTLAVHVDDDGPGIARGEREHVLTWRYYMSTPPSQQAGCRAELVIARQILRAHGGDIIVGSSPLGGARFTVRLPLLAEHQLELAAAS